VIKFWLWDFPQIIGLRSREMTENITKESRICKNLDCKKQFEAEVIELLGAKLLRGDGYCQECAKKMFEEEEAHRIVVEKADIDKKRRHWRENCGIPPKFINEDFSTFEKKRQPEAFKWCWEYAEKYPLPDHEGQPYFYERGYPSLLLFSNNSWGVGKTHLACAICNRILDRWDGQPMACPVKLLSEPELFMRIQATYNYSFEEKQLRESESDILNGLIAAKMLVLDDVGKRRVLDPRFVQRILFTIVDGRYKAERPMVITANLNPAKLKAYLSGGVGDNAIYNRLIEMCKGKSLQIDGESYRREK